MPREIEFMGTLLPALVPAFIAAALCMLVIDALLAKYAIYRLTGYPALFRTALFIVLFSAFGLCIY